VSQAPVLDWAASPPATTVQEVNAYSTLPGAIKLVVGNKIDVSYSTAPTCCIFGLRHRPVERLQVLGNYW